MQTDRALQGQGDSLILSLLVPLVGFKMPRPSDKTAGKTCKLALPTDNTNATIERWAVLEGKARWLGCLIFDGCETVA